MVSLMLLTTFLVLALDRSTTADLNSRVIRTKEGAVRGVIVTPSNRQLQPVEVFRGVPFAAPPVGALRLKPPVPSPTWTGVRPALVFGPACPQRVPLSKAAESDPADDTLAPVPGAADAEADALTRMPRGRLAALRKLSPLLRNQDEDCLYLNLYAPAQAGSRSQTSPAPVLVIVHGDSYSWGTGNVLDGTVLASYGGLVVVTLNYRLGALGFLDANAPFPGSAASSKTRSNLALLDIVAALHWLQLNVAAFGGDPNRVTLLGHGRGAVCVHLLMLSEGIPSGQLFHRVGLMSGSAFTPDALVRDPAAAAMSVAARAGCDSTTSPEDLLKCLRSAPLESLLPPKPPPPPAIHSTTSPQPTSDATTTEDDSGLLGSFNADEDADEDEALLEMGPTVDGVVVTADDYVDPAFLKLNVSGGLTGEAGPDSLLHRATSARTAGVSLLVGVVRAEEFFRLSAADEQFGMELSRRSRLFRRLVRRAFRWHRAEILATVLNEYTDWSRPLHHPLIVRDETLEALGDAFVVAPAVRAAEVHTEAGGRAYFYVFDYQARGSYYQQRQGCVHGEELQFVLGAPLAGPAGLRFSPQLAKNFTRPEQVLAETVMDYWANFAATGQPNMAGNPPGPGRTMPRSRVDWPPYDSRQKRYMLFDLKPRVRSHYRSHRLSFWLRLVPELHRRGGVDELPPQHHQLLGDPPAPELPATLFRPSSTSTTSQTTPVDSATNLTTDSTMVTTPEMSHKPDDLFRFNPQPTQPPAPASYSAALGATVAIGCALLLLNMLVFACVYRQHRDKQNERQEDESRRLSRQDSVRQRGPSLAVPSTATTSLGAVPCAQHNGAPRGMCKADHGQAMSPNPILKSFQHQHQHQHQHLHRPHHCHSHQFHHHQHEHFPHQGCFQHPHGPPGSGTQTLRHSRSHTMLPELSSESDTCCSVVGPAYGVPRPPPPPLVARQPGEHQPLLQNDPCRHMAPGCVNSLDRRWRGGNHLRV